MKNVPKEPVFKLARGVFYRHLENVVYLRNTATKSEYTFNAIAGDIFDILMVGAQPLPSIIETLKKKYSISNEVEFTKSVSAFIDNLIFKGIVINENPKQAVYREMNLVSKIQERCTKIRRLWSACLEITYRCNEKCIHCYLDKPEEACKSTELTLDDYHRILDELAELGCMNVLVTGGEPTLRADFIDICEYVISKGMLLDVFTNALNVSDEIFSRLCSLPINSISFSLYGADPAFHDSITKIPGSFDRSFKNILKFKCAGFDVFVKTVLFKHHFDQYLALRKLFAPLGMKVYPSTIITPGHSGALKNDMMLDKEDFRRLFRIEKQDRQTEKNMGEPVKENLWRKMDDPICSAGYTQLSFAPNGDVLPCNAMPVVLGNVKKQTIRDIWENSSKLAELRKIRFGDLSKACSSCRYSGVCNVCLGASFAENEGVVKPCSHTCEYARLRYEEAF